MHQALTVWADPSIQTWNRHLDHDISQACRFRFWLARCKIFIVPPPHDIHLVRSHPAQRFDDVLYDHTRGVPSHPRMSSRPSNDPLDDTLPPDCITVFVFPLHRILLFSTDRVLYLIPFAYPSLRTLFHVPCLCLGLLVIGLYYSCLFDLVLHCPKCTITIPHPLWVCIISQYMRYDFVSQVASSARIVWVGGLEGGVRGEENGRGEAPGSEEDEEDWVYGEGSRYMLRPESWKFGSWRGGEEGEGW